MKKIFDSIHNNLVAQKSEAAYEEARRITLAGETWSSHDCSLVFNKKKAARSRNNLKRRRGIDQKLSVCSTKHFCNEKQLFQPRMIKNSQGQIYEDSNCLFFYFMEYKQYFINAKVLYIDATFQVAAKSEYYQLLTISTKVKINNYEMFLPLCSVLMPNKTLKTYKKVFSHINSRFLGGAKLENLSYLLTDWERSISSGFKSEFNLTNEFRERRCHLHWLRNVEKRAKKQHIWGDLTSKRGLFNRFYQELKFVSHFFHYVTL